MPQANPQLSTNNATQTSTDYLNSVLAEVQGGGTPDPTVVEQLAEGTAKPTESQVAPKSAEAEPKGDGEPSDEPKNSSPAPTETEPEVKEPDPEPDPKEAKRKDFAELVRQKAAERKQREAGKLDAERKAKLERVEAAAASGDALGVLTALGLSYNTAVQQALGIKKDPKKPEASGEEMPAWAKQIQEDNKALREENERYRANQARTDHTRRLDDLVAKEEDKYPLTSARKVAGRALQYLEQYYAETGELPSDNADENYRIALDAVEADLEKEASSWEAALDKRKARRNTAGTDPAKEPSKEAVQPAASKSGPTQSKTLTNTHVPSRTAPAEPKTPEDYQRAVLEELEKQG